MVRFVGGRALVRSLLIEHPHFVNEMGDSECFVCEIHGHILCNQSNIPRAQHLALAGVVITLRSTPHSNRRGELGSKQAKLEEG